MVACKVYDVVGAVREQQRPAHALQFGVRQKLGQARVRNSQLRQKRSGCDSCQKEMFLCPKRPKWRPRHFTAQKGDWLCTKSRGQPAQAKMSRRLKGCLVASNLLLLAMILTCAVLLFLYDRCRAEGQELVVQRRRDPTRQPLSSTAASLSHRSTHASANESTTPLVSILPASATASIGSTSWTPRGPVTTAKQSATRTKATTPKAPPATTVKPPAGCFWGSASVRLTNGSSAPVASLDIGDRVWDGESFTKVYAWLHYNPSKEFRFLNISTEKSSVVLTPNHIVFRVAGGHIEDVLAGDLVVGDALLDDQSRPSRILSIQELKLTGAFAPATESGRLVVGSPGSPAKVLCSAYTHRWLGGWVGQGFVHGIFAPLRLVARIVGPGSRLLRPVSDGNLWPSLAPASQPCEGDRVTSPPSSLFRPSLVFDLLRKPNPEAEAMEASMGAWGSVSEHGAASESGLGTAHSPVVETESFGSAVGKVRWAPRLADGAASGAFWASSAGGPDHRLALWGVVDQDSLDEDQGPRESMAERLSVALPAEVGDLAALGEGRVAVGLADGRVAVVDSSSGTLQSRFSAEWGLKGQGVSSTALQGTSLAVGGDKGHLLLLDLQREAAERSLEASSVTVWSLAWTGARTLVSAGANGLLCLWDLREADKASGPFPLGGRAFRGGLFSVAAHPSQPHLVAAGGLGRVGLVDLRSPNVLLGETLELGTGLGAVWEAAFHPEHPRHLFVVAEDGSLLRLAAGEGGRGAEALKGGREGWAGLGRSGSAAVGAEAWLSGPSIGGLNSLDVQGPRIVVGADAFALHLLHGFMLTD